MILAEHREVSVIPAYKDKERGTWYASFYYTDWQGHRKLKKKRGFARQKDAKAFEDEFLKTRAQSCDMTFGSMVELYLDDMEHRLKANTMRNKRYLYQARILPFFQDLKINDITPAHVRKWQSNLLAEGVAPTYAKIRADRLSDLQRAYQAAVDAGEPGASEQIADLIRAYQRSEGVRLQAVPPAYRVK